MGEAEAFERYASDHTPCDLQQYRSVIKMISHYYVHAIRNYYLPCLRVSTQARSGAAAKIKEIYLDEGAKIITIFLYAATCLRATLPL
jgi:hypothetical protein